MEEVENNKIIAEFCGYQYFPYDETAPKWVNNKEGGIPLDQFNGWRKPHKGHLKIEGWYLCRSHRDLRYHRDWNWFMSAWNKWRAQKILLIVNYHKWLSYHNKIKEAILTNDTPLEASRVLADGVRWLKSIEKQ